MLAVVTGPVRSGKSGVALSLALQSDRAVVIAVGGREDDAEMERRIAHHRAQRPDNMRVLEAGADPSWLDDVPAGACLLVDCLGTILGLGLAGLVDDGAEVADAAAEHEAARITDTLLSALMERDGDTVVVTNEVGWGVVPATPLGRLFRDAVGRANRTLTDASDVAVLVADGRCMDLKALPKEIEWPK